MGWRGRTGGMESSGGRFEAGEVIVLGAGAGGRLQIPERPREGSEQRSDVI